MSFPSADVMDVEFLKECIPALDSDIAKRLRKQLEKQGVEFYMQSAVKCISDGRVAFDLQTSARTLLESRVRTLQMQMLLVMKRRLVEYYQGQPLVRK